MCTHAHVFCRRGWWRKNCIDLDVLKIGVSLIYQYFQYSFIDYFPLKCPVFILPWSNTHDNRALTGLLLVCQWSVSMRCMWMLCILNLQVYVKYIFIKKKKYRIVYKSKTPLNKCNWKLTYRCIWPLHVCAVILFVNQTQSTQVCDI